MIGSIRHSDGQDGDARMPVLIGLSGPIGCGKSTIGRMLAELGGAVIDADALAREVTAEGSSALREIRARFGDVVFDDHGALDRAALARVVFADEVALRDLEGIVHPRVRPLVEEHLETAAREGVPFAAVEAIKLVEGGLAERCDEVWIIVCAPESQRVRLAGRGMAADDITHRLTAQGGDLTGRLVAALAERGIRARSISTDGSLEATREAVEDALAEVLDRPLR